MCHALLFPVQEMAESHTFHVASSVESDPLSPGAQPYEDGDPLKDNDRPTSGTAQLAHWHAWAEAVKVNDSRLDAVLLVF